MNVPLFLLWEEYGVDTYEPLIAAIVSTWSVFVAYCIYDLGLVIYFYDIVKLKRYMGCSTKSSSSEWHIPDSEFLFEGDSYGSKPATLNPLSTQQTHHFQVLNIL